MEYLAIFLPGIIGVKIIDKKKQFDAKNFIFCYALLSLVVNCILTFFYYLKNNELFMSFTCIYSIKYCIVSVFLNIVLAYLYLFFNKIIILKNYSYDKKVITFKKKVLKILHLLLLLFMVVIVVGSFYVGKEYSNEEASELFYYLTHGVGDSDSSVFILAIKKCFMYAVVLYVIFIGFFYNILFKKSAVLNFKGNNINVYPFTFIMKHRVIFTIILFVGSVLLSLNNVQMFKYIKNLVLSSTFIEDNYIKPNSESIIFDKKKKNVVFISLESIETTFFSKEHGGNWDYELMPELFNLLNEDDSIYFSGNDGVGGIVPFSNCEWTTASLVASFTGLPFKVPIDGNSYTSEKFMNGAYAFGDVLNDNSYENVIVSGSNTTFGGLRDFFDNHGPYKIIDPVSVEKYGYKITDESSGPWGFNDNYMFEIAKKELLNLSSQNKPFNLTLISIDTHFPDGFVGNYSLNKFDSQYENSIATESKLVYDFISWIKKQDFYKDTVIVVLGDHPTMQTSFVGDYELFKRHKYNVIINSAVTTKNTKNRIATSMDIYPTVLAAMGAKIKDDKLALGVNLFSDSKTLSEQYGYYEAWDEIDKKSIFYNNEILGSDYYIMISEE